MNLLYTDEQPTKYIWIAPERTGSRATNQLFIQNGYTPRIVGIATPQYDSVNYTHDTYISSEYINNNYAVIYNIRNPYNRFLSFWKKIHIFNQLKRCFVVGNDISEEKMTDLIFSNFFNIKPITTQSKVVILNAQYKKFNIFARDNIDWTKLSFNRKTIFTYNEKYFLRQENLSEDVQKLPFIKNVYDYVSKKDYTDTSDKIQFIKYHFLRTIVCTNNFDIEYYKKFVQDNFILPKIESSYINDFYTKLCNINESDKKDYISFVRSFYDISKIDLSKYSFFDINCIFNGENFYDSITANIVHYNNKDWFELFNYNKDSWK